MAALASMPLSRLTFGARVRPEPFSMLHRYCTRQQGCIDI